MPKHIVRLILLLVVFGLSAYAAKRYFTADSFYEYGHYRGDSVAEMASEKPKYKGSASCKSCHEDQYKQWAEGVHNNPAAGKIVKCEVCHGPGGQRDKKGMFDNVATGPDHVDANLKLIVPTDTVRLCTLCHEQMPGRPTQQHQIVVSEHTGSQQCTACHNAHAPRTFLEAKASMPIGNASVGKGKVDAAGCAGCHGPTGTSNGLPGPNLAGQKDVYLAKAFRMYKSGVRDNPLMKDVAGNVSNADVADIAAYFAAQNCKNAPRTKIDAAVAGQVLASKCAVCHGMNGISRQPIWPNLAGQSMDYLASALQSYKDGSRKNVFMTKVVKDISDADIVNLAAYFSGVACQRNGAE